MESLNNTVPDEKCITQDQFMRYLADQTSGEESKLIDRHINRCPMCADALEGAILVGGEHFSESLSRIDVKLDKVYSPARTPDADKYSTRSSPRLFFLTQNRRAVAAVLIVGVGVGSLWYKYARRENLNTSGWNSENAIVGAPVRQDTVSPSIAQAPLSSIKSQNDNREAREESSFKSIPNKENLQSDETVAAEEQISPKKGANELMRPASAASTKSSAEPQKEERALPKAANYTIDFPDDSAVGSITNVDKASADKPSATGLLNKDTALVQAETHYKNATAGYAGAANNNRQEDAQSLNEVVVRQSPSSNPARLKSKKSFIQPQSSDYQKGILLYDAGEYEEAIVTMNHYLSTAPQKGLEYNKTSWTLANAYLKTNRLDQANALLQRIVKEKSPFASEAARLLKK